MNKIMWLNSKFHSTISRHYFETVSRQKHRKIQTLVVLHPFALLCGRVIHLIPPSPSFLPCSVFPAPSSSPAMGHGPGSTWNPIRHIHYLVTTQSRRAPTTLLSLRPLYISLSLYSFSAARLSVWRLRRDSGGRWVRASWGKARSLVRQRWSWRGLKLRHSWKDIAPSPPTAQRYCGTESQTFASAGPSHGRQTHPRSHDHTCTSPHTHTQYQSFLDETN